nr:reverse transcriptase domain-containing protein [Tanacetum cinerariifolium]
MSTHSSARNVFPPLDNPELIIRIRSHVDHTLLNDFEMATEGNDYPPVPDLWTMEELCQPSLNGRGRPIALIAIQATNFGLKNDIIQQVQNSCQFHKLSGDDANKHLDKFFHVTQSIKLNGVTNDALRLYLFPHSLTHHAIAWFDRLPRNSINTFEQMAKMFLGKYFPPSMVTKLRNEITNFRQCLDESLFEAWERYKLSTDRCGTFMKRHPEKCYDLIENMTAHHNDWDTSAQQSESSSSITSSSDTKIVGLKAKLADINKNFMKVLQINQQFKAVTPSCETCDGPHSYNDCPVTVGQNQYVYAARAYQGGNSHQPQGGTFMKRHPEKCYDLIENMTAHHNDWDTSAQQSESSSSITSSSDTKIVGLKAKLADINKNLMKVLQINQQFKAVTPSCETCDGPHSYNDCPVTVGQNQYVYAARAYQGGNSHQPQGASHGPNPPLAYQASAYQALGYQASIHQPLIPQPQVMTTVEFTNYMKANNSILKNMQTNMTSLINSNLELKNMFSQFMKMNTTSSLGSRTLPSNTVTNLKEDLKGITTQSGNLYQGPTIPTTSSSSPQVVERETEPVVTPVLEPVVAPVSASKPNQRPSIPYLSRLYDQKLCDKTNDQKEKIFKIFQDLNFNISFTDALILMPKFSAAIKSLLTNKDKLFELAITPLNEHCLAVLLKKLPEKLRDPGKFLILCDFLGMDECLALADLGASINLMPLSMWNKLSFPELSPTLMTLELADRSFLKTGRALMDVYAGEFTLQVNNESVAFNLDQTSRYSANYNDMTANRIDVIDMACEEYSKEVL